MKLDALSGTVTLKTEIPVQNLRLKKYRIEYSNDSNAAANTALWIRVPWIGTSNVNTNTHKNGIPLLCSGSAITLAQSNINLGSHSRIPERFDYELTMDSTTGWEQVDLIFEYDKGGLSQ